MNPNTAWDKFMQTGAINDYVSYIKLQNGVIQSTVEGDEQAHADDNNGNYNSGNQYRG